MPAEVVYLQQVFVHDLQAAAAAHALVGGAAGARGHGPWRGGGRQRGGGRAGVLVGRRGARLLRGAAERRKILVIQPAHEHRVALPIHGTTLPHTSSAAGAR